MVQTKNITLIVVTLLVTLGLAATPAQDKATSQHLVSSKERSTYTFLMD